MADKIRENRLRRIAERRSMRLVKSRRRDPLATDFGRWWVWHHMTLLAASITTDEVEELLDSLGMMPERV